MESGSPHKCPVCGARFRGAIQCSRCGADLAKPMLLALSAWRLRNTVRAAIHSQDYARAITLARAAQAQCPVKIGRDLLLLARWLDAQNSGRSRHDIYISYRNEDGSWENPIDVGPPINTERGAICPMVSPDGKYLFFIRNGLIVWVSADVLPKRN